ncbi:hypothetical protein COLO4_35776 [Corchorus olitorius]|uniref:Uncharacterized protein n=1 Tax=Corchorus olitorius TaxID=93759 RepID=A0A1R3GDF7_9ROSI|nr:hypothetical protein COLO4_35776 [Corchorus olitorius]
MEKNDFGFTRLCLALLALFFMAILTWDWDRNTFLSTYASIPPAPATSTASMEPEMKTNSETGQGDQQSTGNVDNSQTLNSTQHLKNETKVCNYAKGRWVAENRVPFYNHGCEYINTDWNCRAMNRTDFSYEKYRWEPLDCQMPEFDPFDFLKRMQNKTVAFIGDSLSKQQFESLMCMLTGGKVKPEVQDISEKYDGLLVIRDGAIINSGWAYRFSTTNTTILHAKSLRLSDRNPIITNNDSATVYAMHLDSQPPFIRKYIDQLDVLVINTGHHWSDFKMNQSGEVLYLNGKPIKNKFLKNITHARNFKVNYIIKWLDSKMGSRPNMQVFFRTNSPVHFFKGEWNTGGRCDNTVPMTRGSKVSWEESMDKAVEDSVKGTRVKILDITALSELRDEAHISRYGRTHNDCSHWCLPGVPDTWNELLNALLLPQLDHH